MVRNAVWMTPARWLVNDGGMLGEYVERIRQVVEDLFDEGLLDYTFRRQALHGLLTVPAHLDRLAQAVDVTAEPEALADWVWIDQTRGLPLDGVRRARAAEALDLRLDPEQRLLLRELAQVLMGASLDLVLEQSEFSVRKRAEA